MNIVHLTRVKQQVKNVRDTTLGVKEDVYIKGEGGIQRVPHPLPFMIGLILTVHKKLCMTNLAEKNV